MLLDTHALFWWDVRAPRLPDLTRALIADPANLVFISAISAWELVRKHRAGKWPEAERLATNFANLVRGYGFTELPVTIAHAVKAGSLDGGNRDPFDRLLAGQALIENLGFVTADAGFREFGVSIVWDGAST